MNGFKFVFRYLAWAAFLYVLFFFESFSPLFFVQAWQTQLTIWLTHLWIDYFEIAVKMIGNTVYLKDGFKIWVEDSCNGLLAYLLYAVAILAFPANNRLRFIWLLEGYLYLVLVNSIRIDFVIYISMFDSSYFHFVHDCIGRGFIFINLVVMFMLFTLRVQVTSGVRKRIERRKHHLDRRHAHGKEWRAAPYERRHGEDRRKP